MKKKLFVFFVLIFSVMSVFSPLLVFGQGVTSECDTFTTGQELERFLCKVGYILNYIIPIIIILGVVYFMWGVISYAIAKDEEAKTKGRGAMISGIIALAVIVSVWGLVNILKNFVLGNTVDDTVTVPCLEIGGVDCPQ